MLTQAELKSKLNYDPETGLFTWLVANSSQIKVSDIAGCKHANGYILIGVNAKRYLAHRLAWLYMIGETPKNDIDHINGVRDDNRIVNLRAATRSENMQNLRKATVRNKSSGLLGATWSKASKKWQSQIKFNGKAIHLGYFNDKYAAHEAYLKKKREIHTTCTI